MTPPTIQTVAVPGARLHCEVRGAGPLLLVVGSPMGSHEFAPFADALATDYTVVTLDPRGHGRSTIENPDDDTTVDQRADDLLGILDALGAESADVFGSSGGAVTGLALVTHHPTRVRTLVAHEPPLLELLPDADVQRAATEDIITTFHSDGMGAAWAKFMINAGFDMTAPDDDDAPAHAEMPEPSEQDLREAARFFDHELRPTTRYVPDAAALADARVVIGIGADSKHLLTYPTSVALARLLGVTPVEFPGDHGGFLEAPTEFAKLLTEVLGDQRQA
jgi:pimeloyl-ACP methyl ester carboxylesterase